MINPLMLKIMAVVGMIYGIGAILFLIMGYISNQEIPRTTFLLAVLILSLSIFALKWLSEHEE